MRPSRWSRVNPWKGLSGLPRELWVLFVASLVNKAGSMVLPFFVLYLTRDAGFSVQTASLMVLLYGAGALVAAPVAGRLSDRLGPILIMRASLLLSGVVLLAFPFARGLPAIVAMTLVLSVTSEAFRPANLTIMGDLVSPERRKTAFALNRLAINLGMSVGPALGGLLATVSFRWLFFVDGATAVVAGVILAASQFPPHRRTADLRQVEDAVAPHLRLPRGAHRDPRLLYFLAAMFPIAVVFFQHISSMPLYMVQDLHLSAAAYGLLFTVNTLLIVFLEVGINTRTSHWPHRRTLTLGSALCGLGFGALAWSTNVWEVGLTVVIWTFGEMLIFPGMADYLTDIAPESRRGEYMGLSQMMMGLAFSVGPWAGLQILALFGGQALWLTMLALGLAAAAMMSRLQGTAHPVRRTAVPLPTTSPSTEP
jgi:predicted MFS family arabinose efflux permease